MTLIPSDSKLPHHLASKLANEIAARDPHHLDNQADLLRAVARALQSRANALERITLVPGPEAA